MSSSLKPRVFLSRTTKGLATLADKVAVVLDDMGYEVIHEPDFTWTWRKIRHYLMQELRTSDAVLCLIGPGYGSAPRTPIPEFRDLDTGREAFSYTQLEYLIARRLHRPVFTILVPEDCDTFPLDTFTQDDTERDLQRDFIRDIIKARKNEHLYYDERSFPTHDALFAKLREALHGLTTLPPSHPENIPFPSIGKVFTGRADTLRHLRETLVAAGSERPAVQVLHGTGGVGKTRVTVEYAHTFHHDYTARLFVTGNSPGALDGALSNLAGIFLLNLEEQDEKENDVRIAAVLRWLAQHPGWLLVIDNVDTREARDHALHIVSQLPPGHVLITTRIHTWPGHLLRTPLDVLSDTDGRDLLLAYRSSPKAEAEDTDAADALSLAHDLDGLALALEQAAAYLNQIAVTIAEYHQRWKANAERVKEWTVHEKLKNPEQGDTEANKLRVSVATTWLTSFEQLTPAAQSFLNLLAWLAPDPIPRFLLKPLAEKKLQPDPLNGTDPYLTLGNLTDFSLAKPDRKGVAFSVHRLIQEISRERQEPPKPANWLLNALALVEKTFPDPPTDVRVWDVAIPLSPHAVAVAASSACRSILEPTSLIFNLVGHLALARSQMAQAKNAYEQAWALDSNALPPNPRNESRTLASLAMLYEQTGRFAEADDHYARAIALAEDVFGQANPSLATWLNNYGILLIKVGKFESAEKVLFRAFESLREAPDRHYQVLGYVCSGLGHVCKMTSRPEKAEQFFRYALRFHGAEFGLKHPVFAETLNNFGEFLVSQKRFVDATPLLLHALEIDETSYDRPHTFIARDLDNLGRLWEGSGDLEEAKRCFSEALEMREQLYGASHPSVAQTLNNLSVLLVNLGDYEQAELLIRRAISIDEAHFGTDHFEVAMDRYTLAQVLAATQRLPEARTQAEMAMKAFLEATRRTGFEHPHCVDSIRFLISLRMQLGESAEQALSNVRSIVQPYGMSI